VAHDFDVDTACREALAAVRGVGAGKDLGDD
jgi:hypothetical protein